MILGAGVAAAHAEDWNAIRLRGTVLELVNGAWQPVHETASPSGSDPALS